MSSARFSSPLRDGVQRLDITTRVTLAVLVPASGVYTYLGVRDLLNGNATIVFRLVSAVPSSRAGGRRGG
ncbi:hypothetical protein [Pseudorhodoplanes sp.]|uniref:hypothetical protein n=1 Tax=Pseudorhodoplanes sp. TaxID=1934341 RepID=UPI00391C5FAD